LYLFIIFLKSKMKYYLKLFFIEVCTFLCKLLWIFPVKKSRVLFLSYNGLNFNDSPYYIYKSLVDESDLQLIWGLKPNKGLESDKIDFVHTNTLKYIYYFCTSKVIVANDFVNIYLPIRKRQYLINTWHGGGWFKTVGLTCPNVPKYDYYFFRKQMKKHTYFLASSEYFVDTVLYRSFGYTGEVLRIGMPRNAILLQNNNNLRKSLRMKFDIDDDSLLVLYAPTFRTYTLEDVQSLDINRLMLALGNKFGKNIKLLFRAHHAIKSFNIDENQVIDVTSYPDMQELLLSCDILLSDFSSCMWDAAIQHKLVLVFAPDQKQYEDSRGFFMEMEKWPFLISHSNNELVRKVETFNKIEYSTYLDKVLRDSVSWENADSVFSIRKKILSILK